MRLPIIIFLAAVVLCHQMAGAQAIAPAAFDRADSALPEQVRFGQRITLVGDQIEQRWDIRFQLETTSRRGNEILDQQTTEIRREQHRVITAAEVTENCMTAAHLKFLIARKGSGAGGNVSSADALPSEPVEGKAYSCCREGNELIVQTSDGQTPPPAELEIVALSMESLGERNWLAGLLLGRTFSIGEKIVLPPRWADGLLGATKKLGNVARFELRLDDLAEIDGVQCAVFTATIEVEGSGSRQMRMQMDGTLAIEIDTCRIIKTELSGPLAMLETRGSLTSKYQLTSRGRLTVALRSNYLDTRSYSPAIE